MKRIILMGLMGLIMLACTTVQQASTTPVLTETADTEKAAEPEQLQPETELAPEPKEPQTAEESNAQPVTTSCTESCEHECERSAHFACSQEERSECKAKCGTTIDPSACSQACAFINQPAACRKQMEQFCKNQCAGKCR